MNATEQLEKIKSWLNQADEKYLDAFASQNQTLISHICEIWQRFQEAKNITSLENNMLTIQPTETTPVYKKSSSLHCQMQNKMNLIFTKNQ